MSWLSAAIACADVAVHAPAVCVRMLTQLQMRLGMPGTQQIRIVDPLGAAVLE